MPLPNASTDRKEIGFYFLQNIHLVRQWLPRLEKKLEIHADGAHQEYRVFMSAEPASKPENHILPQVFLHYMIFLSVIYNKKTSVIGLSELILNFFVTCHRVSWSPPSRSPTSRLGACKPTSTRRSTTSRRRRSRCAPKRPNSSPSCSLYVTSTHASRRGESSGRRDGTDPTPSTPVHSGTKVAILEANSKVPWEDLRYLFGEIMYGGHITDDWDRRLCRTYLEEFLHPDQVAAR